MARNRGSRGTTHGRKRSVSTHDQHLPQRAVQGTQHAAIVATDDLRIPAQRLHLLPVMLRDGNNIGTHFRNAGCDAASFTATTNATRKGFPQPAAIESDGDSAWA
jgi:hypothetical protein